MAHETEIYELGQVQNAIRSDFSKQSEQKQKEAFNWFSVGSGYYHSYFKLLEKINKDETLWEPGFPEDQSVNANNFQQKSLEPEIQRIIDFYNWLDQPKPEQPKKTPPPAKEETSVPAELETLVALKKAHDADIEVDTKHTVAETVKRARQTWLHKHEVELAKENRLKQIEDAKEKQKLKDADNDAYENFVISSVNPKAKSSREIYHDLALAAEEAIRYQDPSLTDDEVADAVYNLTYLTLSGSVDISNPRQFYIATQLAIKEAGGSISKELDQIDNLERSRLDALDSDPFSDKPEEIQSQINLIDEAISQKINDASLGFSEKIQKEYQDFDIHFPEAIRQNSNIQNAFIKAIPNAKLPLEIKSYPLQSQVTSLEAAIRKNAPDVLTINPTAKGSQYAGFLQITGSSNRNISAEAARFLGLGLTKEKLDAAEKDASSALGKLYHSKEFGSVFKQVHFQIKKIQASEAGKDIEKGLRPVGGIDKYFNRLNPTAQSALKFALDPRGTLTSWASQEAGRRLGRHLIEHVGSELAQQAGNLLLKEGLIGGANAVIKQAASKAVTKAAGWLALKMGWHAFAESLNVPAPLVGIIIDILGSIVIEIAQRTIGAAWNAFQNLHREMYGHDFSFKEASIPVIAGGVTLAGIATTGIAGFIALRRATQIAVISAIGIIITSAATILFYVGFSYAVAPILSTLVQLDSVEKVKYEDYTFISASGDCGWPTAGHYTVISGPIGGTHYKNKLEAIDIAAPNLTAHLSATDGVVSYTGVYSNYGNTVVVSTTNSAGSFDVYYGHLAVISVGKGQQVKKGQKIGVVGGTGGWTPHIHMEYKGIKYNQCPAGGLQIRVGCCVGALPNCNGSCNAFSN